MMFIVLCVWSISSLFLIQSGAMNFELGVKSLVAMAMRMHDLDWDPNIDNC